MNKIIIVLDSKEGHITKVFTSDPGLIVRVVDLDTEAQEPVWGPYDPGVRVVVADVHAAAMEHIKENVPDYESEEEQEIAEEGQESILTFLQELLRRVEDIPEVLGDAEDILIDDAAMSLLEAEIENITKRIRSYTRTLDLESESDEYKPEDGKEEQEFAVRWTHTGKYEATYLVTARNLEEAVAYVTEHRQELEPTDVVPLSDDYRQFL